MGFNFLPFCYFLYCVFSFWYHFLLLPGEGGVSLFFIFKLLIYIFVLFLLFEGRKRAWAFL
jgi:hypothetical protein